MDPPVDDAPDPTPASAPRPPTVAERQPETGERQPEIPEPAKTPERSTSPVELLWDLVFVFAVTQVTTLLARDPGWGRFGQAMLALALVWWAWSAFVWAANAHEAESRELRGILLAATVLIFIVGLALPHAFGADAITFAAAYAAVRLLHLALYAAASRQGRARRSSIGGFAGSVAVGIALLLAGALAGGGLRDALWAAAVVIDYAGPGWLTRDRLRGLQQVAVAHLADRYGAFVIICLGESIVSIGVGVGDGAHPLSAGLVVIAAVGLLITVAMWWTYFDRLARDAQRRLRDHPDPVLAATDAFSILHLVIVAGIIVLAMGIRLDVRGSIADPMPVAGRLAFCGGIALYLAGVSAFRLRLLGVMSPGRLLVALALLVLAAAGGGLPAWSVTVIAAVLLGVLCAGESAQSAVTGPAAASVPR